jgi:3-oxoacyl-[acyl-carrier-protein] synthase-3
MNKLKITSVGSYVPSNKYTNEKLSTLLNTSDEWIYKRTGIKERRWADKEETSDLACKAAKKAIKKAGWNLKDIDLIILSTQGPDVYIPGTGPIVQYKLGLETTPTLDIRQQCTGFIYGLMTAEAYIKSGLYNRILFICSEVQSNGLDISTRGRDMAVLFGDGAGALCLESSSSNNEGIISFDLHTEGKNYKNIILDCHPKHDIQWIKDGKHWPQMKGHTIFLNAIKRLTESINTVLTKANMSIDNIDLIIPHQANLRINEAVAKQLNISKLKVFSNIKNYGNTTSASIPIALDELLQHTKFNNKTILFTAFGSGETWGSIIYKWHK